MKVRRLDEMTKGWFVGDFEPSVLRTKEAEVAVKRYDAGTLEDRHVHQISPEITVIIDGRARMNDSILEAGDIVLIEAGESADFEALTGVTTVVVKVPSVSGDKYPC